MANVASNEWTEVTSKRKKKLTMLSSNKNVGEYNSRTRYSKLKRKTNLQIKNKCKNQCDSIDEFLDECVTTDTHISMRDCSDPNGDTYYHYITPCELSVDTLQIAINNNLIHCIKNQAKHENGKEFVSLVNFPSLQIETMKAIFKDTRQNKSLVHCYEDNSIPLLSRGENINNYMDNNTFNINVNVDGNGNLKKLDAHKAIQIK